MIKAKNMMTGEVITISPESSLLEAAKIATSKSVSSLVVMEKDKPIAVLSERDLIKGMLSKNKKVREVMSKNFFVISPNTTFYEVNRKLREQKINRFPVIGDNKLIGIITETDIVEATRDFTRFHQIIQDVILGVFGVATAFFLFYFSPLRAAIFG